jgi:hypothetical protein
MNPRQAWRTTVALSVFSFLTLFHAYRVTGMSFWIPMAMTSGACAVLGLLLSPESRRRIREDLRSGMTGKVLLGLLSAAILYLVFWIGNGAVRFLLPVTGEGIDRVYTVADGTPRIVIFAWIALVIGPAEEILWRGVIQAASARNWSRWTGFGLAALLYAAVHVTSGNPMLVVAAAVCGIFWGLLYLWKQSIVLNTVSHVVWDLSVFLWFPFATSG